LWRAKTAQHRGLELVERTNQQLVVAAIDDAGPVGRDGNVAIDGIQR